MITTEVRLHTPDRLEEALSSRADVVGVGQEGCLAKLPDADELRTATARVRAAGRAPAVVAPIAWPSTAETVAQRMRDVAADGPLTVVVNDVTTLLELRTDRPDDCQLVVGLALTRGPAHSADPAAERSPQPVLDTALLHTLGRDDITGVETDTDTRLPEEAAQWGVRQLLDVAPVGYARSCPTARDHQLAPPACRSRCDAAYRITPTQRWRLNDGQREPLPVAATRPTLTVWGNAVYQPTHHAPVADYRIVDARWVAPGALPEALARAQRAPTAH